MDWIQCEILSDDLERVMGALAAVGIYEYEIVESFEKIRKQLDEMESGWDFIDEEKVRSEREKIIVYLADEPENADRFLEMQTKLKELPVKTEIVLKQLADSEWIDSWKQYFTQVDISEKVVVVPLWQQELPEDKVVIRIDPGMIFGTGSHATTQLCMRELERLIRPGDEVLDLGCGSGILSMLSILLGADYALGVDIDPGAKKIVAQNCQDNGIGPGKIQVLIGDLLQDQKLIDRVGGKRYDMVVANIVADVIIGILPLVKRCAKGVFICSGIIKNRVADVEQALEAAGFVVDKVQMEDEWAVMTTHVG